MGFVGRVEYRHVYSRSGGGQYVQGGSPDEDQLIAYAEAFEKDSDPEDYSLESIVAHERGHQILARHPRVASLVAGRISMIGEEVLASVIGALLSPTAADRHNLLSKAVFELVIRGEDKDVAERQIFNLRDILEQVI